MSAFDAGYESYWCNVAYDYYATYYWKQGWLAAEHDDLYGWY